MSKRELGHNLGRTFLILDLIGRGVPSTDIPSMIDHEISEIGRTSEEKAIRIISSMPVVLSVVHTDEEVDRKERFDLIVNFKVGSAHEPVFVQVKSSEPKIQSFFRKCGFEERRRKRLIGLNAGRLATDKYIQKSFLDQLRRIDDFV